MISLIRQKHKILVQTNPNNLKLVRTLLSDKLSIENINYKFIEKSLYSLNYRLNKIQDEINSYSFIKNSEDTLYDLSIKLKEVEDKITGTKQYLKYSSPTIKYYHISEVGLDWFDLGFIYQVKTILKEANFEFKIKMNYKYPEVLIDKSLFTRKYQLQAVEKIIKNHIGIIKLPTGSGKTVIAEKTIKTLTPYFQKGNGVIFIVEQKDLLLQTKNAFPDDIKKHIGIIGGGLCEIYNKSITIATVQSLQSLKRKNKKDYQLLCNTSELMIVDECDMFTTPKRTVILKDFYKSKWKVFLSATPFSRFKEEAKWNLLSVAGRILIDLTEQDLMNKKFLSKQKAIFIKSYCPLVTERGGRWLDLYNKFIVKNDHRNKILGLQIFKILKKYDLRTLFIVEQKEHGNLLKKLFNIPFVAGKDDIYQRKNFIDDLESGKEKMLISTRIFRRAINIPSLQVIVNFAGYKSDSMITQTKGRIGRITNKKNKALYIDFFDYGNKHLENHSEERTKTLELINLEIDNIYIDKLENNIKEYFNL